MGVRPHMLDQGKLSLNDNIEKYLNGYKIANPYGTPVTIEMLLTHSTGFEVRDPTGANIIFDNSREPITLEEHIFDNFPPVVREPGTSYMYDNFAFDLLGYIVQMVSGQSFSDYMEDGLFKPLGMNLSSFVLSEDLVIGSRPLTTIPVVSFRYTVCHRVKYRQAAWSQHPPI